MKTELRSGKYIMKNDVVLLFGGNSEERLVSVASAQNLARQFSFSEFIFQDNSERLFKVTDEELFQHADVFVKEFKPAKPAFAESLNEALDYFKNKVVFLGWHGAHGENGEIQFLFETHKIIFTGSGSESSQNAFEKNQAKEIISNTDIKIPLEIKFENSQTEILRSQFEKFLNQHKKIVFKPTASGSSYGLHIVSDVEKLNQALELIKKDSFKSYLVENFINGRELTVGVVQMADELIALPASEIILNEGSAFDYEGKYLGTGATEITPANLTSSELEVVQKLALDAHIALGCYGYSRTDLILTTDGAYFLETNTLPGLSKPSFLPQQLLAADIPFKNFIEAQINLARHRYETD